MIPGGILPDRVGFVCYWVQADTIGNQATHGCASSIQTPNTQPNGDKIHPKERIIIDSDSLRPTN